MISYWLGIFHSIDEEKENVPVGQNLFDVMDASQLKHIFTKSLQYPLTSIKTYSNKKIKKTKEFPKI
jgi:hypothetical protein